MHTDIFHLRFLKIYCGVFNCFRQKQFFFLLKFLGLGKLLGSGRGAEFKKNHKDGYKSELFKVQIAFLLGSSSLFFISATIPICSCLPSLPQDKYLAIPLIGQPCLFIILPDPN